MSFNKMNQVTLSLEPGFKRSITQSFKDDAHLEDEFKDIAQIYEFADITWYPSQYQAVYRYDNRVPLNSLGDGIYDFIGFQSLPTPVYMAARATGSSPVSLKPLISLLPFSVH